MSGWACYRPGMTFTERFLRCVWELLPLGHERSARVRHMLAPPRPDLAAYLADMLAEGKVGGAV